MNTRNQLYIIENIEHMVRFFRKVHGKNPKKIVLGNRIYWQLFDKKRPPSVEKFNGIETFRVMNKDYQITLER